MHMSHKFQVNNSQRARRKVKIILNGLKLNPVMEKAISRNTTRVAVYGSSHDGELINFPNGGYRVKVISVPSGSQTIKDVSEGEVVYALEMTERIQRTLRDIRAESRKNSSHGGGGGGGNTPTSRIFHRLVDEDKLADCIILIVRHFFQGEKECKICDVEFNLYNFFLLVQFYFKYIRILVNDKQLPFCKYLKKKVFGGKDKVNVRNFNIYSNKDAYTNFAKLLADDTNNEKYRFDSRPTLPREKTENYLLAPFQEIGWKFQHSLYFAELRQEIENVNKFIV